MPGKLNVYGWKGVNVDKSPLQLEDGELTKSQNAHTDPLGSTGALRKRPGLVKLNSLGAAGSIVGASPVPLTKPTTRTFYAGQWTGTTAAWNVSTDAWGTGGTSGGPNGFDTSAVPRLPSKVWTDFADAPSGGRGRIFSGRPSCVYRNRFYYAGNDYTVGTTPPPIRMWDGATDYVVTTIPNNPDTGANQASAILSLVAANNRIYVVTYDGGAISANTVKGRVFELDPENGVLSQIGSRFPIDGSRCPYTVAWYMGRLWTRTVTAGIAATSKTYFIRPGVDSDWTLDNTSSGGDLGWTLYTAFGLLFIGSGNDAGTFARVLTRTPLGVYAVSLTATAAGAAGEHNHFGAMTLFNGSLYVSYYNKTLAGTSGASREVKIYKYDGSTWSTVYNTVDAADSVPYHTALVHNGIVYFLSAPAYDSSNNVNQILKSSNGSSWTAVGSSQLANNSSVAFGVITS